jgi:hypothetical protein
VAVDSDFGPWTEGGLGKLRYSDDDGGMNAARVFLEYRGRIAPTLSTTVVADYVGDASAGLDLTEAFLEWRPIPDSRNHHQVRAGAFYPPLSLENSGHGWQSPYSYSFSAIDTWLGEEIRPVGAEWSMRRRLGFAGSPQEIRVLAGAFYGNDDRRVPRPVRRAVRGDRPRARRVCGRRVALRAPRAADAVAL